MIQQPIFEDIRFQMEDHISVRSIHAHTNISILTYAHIYSDNKTISTIYPLIFKAKLLFLYSFGMTALK